MIRDGHPAKHCIALRHSYATAWAESLEGALSGHQYWATLCRHRLPLVAGGSSHKGQDGNAELTRRLQLWEAVKVLDLPGGVLDQQHTAQQNREKKTRQPQTEEQRGKRACGPHGQGINQQSRERTRRWSSSGHGRT